MKNLLLLIVIALATTGCRTMAAKGTPDDLKAVPASQSVALETVLKKIEAKDPEWVDANGNVLSSAIVPILTADKAAWDQLDHFYND